MFQLIDRQVERENSLLLNLLHLFRPLMGWLSPAHTVEGSLLFSVPWFNINFIQKHPLLYTQNCVAKYLGTPMAWSSWLRKLAITRKEIFYFLRFSNMKVPRSLIPLSVLRSWVVYGWQPSFRKVFVLWPLFPSFYILERSIENVVTLPHKHELSEGLCDLCYRPSHQLSPGFNLKVFNLCVQGLQSRFLNPGTLDILG